MQGKTVLASRMLCRSGLGSLIRRTGRHRGFVVLNYHRIGDGSQSEFDHGVYSSTVQMFEKQLRFLRQECDVIGPGDIRDLPRRGRGNYALITFDDGYRDNYQLAYPLLKSLGMVAVFFLATGYIDRPRVSWWDEIAWMVRTSKAPRIGPTPTLPICFMLTSGNRRNVVESLLTLYKKLPGEMTEAFLGDLAESARTGRCPAEIGSTTWMTWDMVREMRKGGMLVGGHTVNHPILAGLSRFEQELEILGCSRRIEEQVGEPMRFFSYPRGKPDAFNDDTRACLYEAQVQYAFSYYGGMNRASGNDAYDLHRVGVEADTPIEHFEAMVTLPRLFA